MTVYSLDVAKSVVEEMNGVAVAVYRYTHAINHTVLYSIETRADQGNTESSSYVINPCLIYTKENGWSKGI